MGAIAALALAGCGTDSNAAAGQLKRATSDVKSILNEHAIQYDHLRCAHVHGGLFHCQVVTFDDLSGDQTLQNVYVRDDGKTVTVTGLNA